ncbi:histone-lysine N-methyltransferase SETMAR [Plakobranchus ocellatus]|uniref:Histone-lysine N-methyltransferase SETMAR n=1 Tax=Plakobranchus ocellatus TaxID=259542 RepID=A0AAV4BR59_9GAST|nr:histone-lysine N-methyltransferase SETMAR [Plakobranchus ocellatus]
MPNYKVHYFDARGRGEIIRLLLTYAGQKFEDNRIGGEDWAKFKPSTPFGQMPVFQIDDKLYGQTTAIANYLAREFVSSKLEIRAVVRFLFAKGTKCSVIYREIVENYGEHAMAMTQVYQWCTWFKDGRTSLQDEPRSGRPNTANNDWNTARVDELIKVGRRVKLKEISLKLDIPKTNDYEIVHDKLGYCKVSARWVPKLLSDEHKRQRLEISQSCCTGVNKKVTKPLIWGLAGTIVGYT